jgi:hypothetical protein
MAETQSSKTDIQNRDKADMAAKPQTEKKHPDEWERDLNPNRMAGQNIGEQGSQQEQGARNAYDDKEIHRTLRDDFEDDELKKIPLVPEGARLQQGATYIDLKDSAREEFTATGRISAEPDRWYVPKDEVPYSLWNRLIGVENPERIAEKSDR